MGYLNIYLKYEKDKFIVFMYIYGYDYYDVMCFMMYEVLKDLNIEYKVLVDNYIINECKCLEMIGLVFYGKNNLMIYKDLGSFFFIGLVFIKEKYLEVIEENKLFCGDCMICIKVCLVGVLDNGFDWLICISGYN